MINPQYKHSELTGKIIGCAMTVHRQLKNGLPESFYHKALLIELQQNRLSAISEVGIPLFYNNIDIGNRFVDIIVQQTIIVELKAVSILEDIHLAQTLNYLELTNFEIGLLINFGGRSLEFKRLINQINHHS